jgi:hypothetical protein
MGEGSDEPHLTIEADAERFAEGLAAAAQALHEIGAAAGVTVYETGKAVGMIGASFRDAFTWTFASPDPRPLFVREYALRFDGGRLTEVSLVGTRAPRALRRRAIVAAFAARRREKARRVALAVATILERRRARRARYLAYLPIAEGISYTDQDYRSLVFSIYGLPPGLLRGERGLP